MSSCVAEKISWLELELYTLHELPRSDAERVAAHLDRCALCRDRRARTEAPLELRPLRTPERRRARAPFWRSPWLAAACAAAVALLGLAVWRSAPHAPGGPSLDGVTRVKGGELTLALVRERQGSIAHDPYRFAPGDRFKLVVSCPPGAGLRYDVVAFQGRGVFFPLERGVLEACGNGIALPGALFLDAEDADVAATLCVVLDSELPTREALREQGIERLPAATVCRRIEPR